MTKREKVATTSPSSAEGMRKSEENSSATSTSGNQKRGSLGIRWELTSTTYTCSSPAGGLRPKGYFHRVLLLYLFQGLLACTGLLWILNIDRAGGRLACPTLESSQGSGWLVIRPRRDVHTSTVFFKKGKNQRILLLLWGGKML